MSEHDQPTEARRCFRPTEELRIIAAEGKSTFIEGLAVPYESASEDLGGFREIVKRHAFEKVIEAGADLRADVEHDRTLLLARSSKGTLELRDSDEGLRVRIQVPETSQGRDVIEQVRNGNYDAMSVSWAFDGVVEQWKTDDAGRTVREIHEAELTGVTLTAFPAYPQTAGEVELRSLSEWKARQDGGEETPDETPTEVLRQKLDLAEAEK